MADFGDRFRKAREKKEFSFDDVSRVIKISPRMLQAIEEEQFDRLPGGVFNKGFIRAYAKHLALDPEEAVNDYLALVRQEQVKAQQAWQAEHEAATRAASAKAATSSKPPSNRQGSVEVEELPDLHLPRAEHVRPARKSFPEKSSPDIPWRLIAVGAVVVVLGIVLWVVRHSHQLRTQSPIPAPVSAKAPEPAPPQAAGTPSLQGQPSTPNPRLPRPAVSVAPVKVVSEENKNEVADRNLTKPVPKPAEQTTGTLTLVVRATENSWISVIADGQTVAQETLIAPANATFHASSGFVVKVGNAAGVSFSLNGADIAPQGGEAEVKTLSFDNSGVKTLSPHPSPPSPN